MPYKTGKMKGELTTPEIRKLIRAHNVLVSIKIPKGSKREDIIALVKKNGYMVDHEKQALVPKVQMKRKPKVDMKSADKVLPKPKTKEEKAASKKSRDMKKKEKEDKIKAEGVKQGAALQRVISKRKVKKVEPKKEKKEEKKEQNTLESKEQEIKELFTKALSPELKKAYEAKDKAKMKTTFNKAVKILAEYLGKTGFATGVPQARRSIVNGMLGRVIKNFGEGKELKEPFIFRKIDLSDVYNREMN